MLDAQIWIIADATEPKTLKQEVYLFSRTPLSSSADAKGFIEAANFGHNRSAQENGVGCCADPNVEFVYEKTFRGPASLRVTTILVHAAASYTREFRVAVELLRDGLKHSWKIAAVVIREGDDVACDVREANITCPRQALCRCKMKNV